MHPEFDAHLADLKAKSRRKYRDDIWKSLVVIAIAGGLAYWAYETVAHAILFAFMAYCIAGVGNRISGELYQWRTSLDGNKIMDKLGM
jgi:hypothetical protein